MTIDRDFITIERRMMEKEEWDALSAVERKDAEQVIEDIAPADTDEVVLELTKIQRTSLRDSIGKRLYYRALKSLGFSKAIATMFKATGDVQWETATGTYRLKKVSLVSPGPAYLVGDESADR